MKSNKLNEVMQLKTVVAPVVYSVIYAQATANAQDGNEFANKCNWSINEIADRCRMKRESVKLAIEKLLKNGFIEQQGYFKSQRSNAKQSALWALV